MPRLSKAEEEEIVQFIEDAAQLGTFYFSEAQHRDAFNLGIRFGQIALSVHGTEAPDYGSTPEESKVIDRLAKASLAIGVVLFKKIPGKNLRRLEREFRDFMIKNAGPVPVEEQDQYLATEQAQMRQAIIDQTWLERETELSRIRDKQRRKADKEALLWYRRPEEPAFERQLSIEIKQGKNDQFAYDNEVKKEEKARGRLTPEKLADYFRDNLGDYFTNKDLSPLATSSYNSKSWRSKETARMTVNNTLSTGVPQIKLAEEGITLHTAMYALNGVGRKRKVYVALPDWEEPQWPLFVDPVQVEIDKMWEKREAELEPARVNQKKLADAAINRWYRQSEKPPNIGKLRGEINWGRAVLYLFAQEDLQDLESIKKPKTDRLAQRRAEIDISWEDREDELTEVASEQRRIANTAIREWYMQEKPPLKRDLNRELRLGRADQKAYESESSISYRRWVTSKQAASKHGDVSSVTAPSKQSEEDDDMFPPGFEERISELEERLKSPPPHDEIIRQLRANGFWDKSD